METKFTEWLRETHRERERKLQLARIDLWRTHWQLSDRAPLAGSTSWRDLFNNSRDCRRRKGAHWVTELVLSRRVAVTGFYLLYTCKTIWNVSRTKRSKNKYSLYATQNSLKMYEMCASEKDIYVPSYHSSTLPLTEHRARPWGQTKFSLQAESRFDCLPPCLPSCLTVWKRICYSASRPPDDLSIVGKLSATLPPDRLPAKWQVRHVG